MSFLDDKPDVHRDKIGHRVDPMLNTVHVDEKWFNHDKKTGWYYLLSGEDPPERHRHSARHIEKTMFWPRLLDQGIPVSFDTWDPHRKTNFDGKLGLWSFAEGHFPQRRSQYRPKGTILQGNIESVDTAVNPRKWPICHRGEIIYEQQDNASPHVLPDDEDVVREGQREGWDIRLIFQPSNSSDFNVLDLGYSAIQNLQYQTYVASTLEPIEVVQNLFRILDKVTLDNIFLTLQQVMVCVLACDGDNEYKLPHMGKAKQRRNGTLKQCVVCSSEVYASAFSKLSTEEGKRHITHEDCVAVEQQHKADEKLTVHGIKMYGVQEDRRQHENFEASSVKEILKAV
ncbi:hypothetical protein L916_13052 [Phytophthora nicotianae]|uniref:Uncharacterized protein n=1 Tax=Phytophthora nicotianae TaxID=4792 RepID=W2IKJ6_PHYNI|nr:hypothetical protein L916_13052 [Phytophthora nicotianae]